MKTNTCRAICLWAALGVTVWLSSTTVRAQSRSDGVEQCRQAAKAESSTNNAQKRQDQIDAGAESTIDHRDCGTDRACNSNATRKYNARQVEIANRATAAEAKVRKDEIVCINGIEFIKQQPKLDPRGSPLPDPNTPDTWTDAEGNEQPLSNRYIYTTPDGKQFAFPKVIDERSSGGNVWVLDPKSIVIQQRKGGLLANSLATYRNQSDPQYVMKRHGTLVPTR
jgi:hypothetical protein